MQLEFLGTGTSYGVPQIGCKCEVCCSEDKRDHRLRCSIWISDEFQSLIIDTGPDFRTQCLRSKIQHLDAVFYTHFHADHIFGVDDIRQFNSLQKSKIPIYLPEFMIDRFRLVFDYTLEEAKPGLNRPQLKIQPVNEFPIQLKDLTITPVDVYHGKERITGYIIFYHGIKISYLVDCKFLPQKTIEMVKGSDVVILSALWKAAKSHPGHLNLEEAIALASTLEGKTTFLTHITHGMGKYTETQKILPKNINLAYDGLKLEWAK